ncbi:hypothetical protein HGRIS_009449 [Hohenbuehelia grisea]|uniref:Uncharacterized protein n=1 Tax=Hohenbuehelia grisea TaxID=104357 RepID=A0ABR3J1Q4_9AGAR
MYTYNPHTPWNQPQSGAGPSQDPSLDHRRAQYRPTTASHPYYAPSSNMHASQPVYPSHPSALRPGYAPSTTHNSDLFFSSPPAPAMPPVPMRPKTSSGYDHQAHAHHYSQPSYFPSHPPQNDYRRPHGGVQSHQGAPMHRHMTAPAPPPQIPPPPPPIPPKPSHHHTLPPSLSPPPRFPPHSYSAPAVPQAPQAPPIPPIQRLPTPAEDPPNPAGDELALALALSQSESNRHKLLVDKLSSQEENDLARALEESMHLAESRPPQARRLSLDGQSSISQVKHDLESISRSHSDTLAAPSGPSTVPSPPASASAPAPSSSSSSSFKHILDLAVYPSSQMSEDEALARRLAEETDGEAKPPAVTSPNTKSDVSDDEAYARSLSQDETSFWMPFERKDTTEGGETPTTSTFSQTSTKPSPVLLDDEAFARQLAAADAQRDSDSRSQWLDSPTIDAGPSYKAPLKDTRDWMTEDEALARKLAAEDEEENSRSRDNSSPDPIAMPVPVTEAAPAAIEASSSAPPPGPRLPAYDDIISGSSNSSQGAIVTSPTSQPSLSSPPSSSLSSTLLPLNRTNSATSIASANSSPDAAPTPASAAADAARGRSSSQTSGSSRSAPPSASSHDGSTAGAPLPPPVNTNQFLDPDLLRGVSIGFMPPTITPRLTPMQGVMPNIVSLPYGRCPPLHLQAPNWRHLLKLMARMSGTRIEPTVEAMAVAKHTLHLRTVVQFVKPHHSALDWRVVLWLTIDHPVPPAVPNARKYLNGDVNMLPWTYTLSTVPALLRDADSPISKFYVVPATDSMPYPVLPISFPDLAMYLQASLEESRRHMNDSSSGRRKLAKMLEMCYPHLALEDEEEDRERVSGVGGLFKRVMGRGNRNQRQGRGNADRYELVTPFIADEWG